MKRVAGDRAGPGPWRLRETRPRAPTNPRAPSLMEVRKTAEFGPIDLEIRLRRETRMIATTAVTWFTIHQS